LDGGGFFYPNPLESMGQHQRQPWFGCACCPSNICRFIPSVPGYIYAIHNSDVYVNLFMSNNSSLMMNGKQVNLKQTTNYPLSGDIKIEVVPKGKQNFNLKIRIPGWVQGNVVPGNLYSYSDKKTLGYSIKVNGQKVEGATDKGYFNINRTWMKGDLVEIHFDMEPRTVKANSKVEADKGKIAVECGPLVYCAEWPDNDFSVLSVMMNKKPVFSIESKPELLYGINMLQTNAQTLSYDAQGRLVAKDVKLKLIPYYAWAHRGSGEMAVWLPIDLSSTRPIMPPTIASESKISASHNVKSISAINDGLLPKDENDHTIPYYHWWPKEGTTEWISYDFGSPKTISRSTVYWFDDSPWGGCRIPQSWKIYYKNIANEWVSVENSSAYGVEKGIGNEVIFKPVTTEEIKMEIKLPKKNAAGIYEWEVE
jgi:hypothetical protein